MKENKTEEIERYLQNLMTEEEVKAFETRLESNQLLKQEVQKLKIVIKGIELNGAKELFTEMNSWEIQTKSDDRLNEDKNDNKTLSLGIMNSNESSSKKTYLLVAASIALLVSMLFGLFDRQSVALSPLNQYEHFSSNLKVTRGAAQSMGKPDKSKAYNLYEIREYSLAAPLLHELYLANNQEEDLFYAALSYLYMGEKNKAMELLQEVELTVRQKEYLTKNKIPFK